MILYYALGGGLGHLTRARSVLEVLGLTRDAALVTGSVHAADPRVTGGLPVIDVPEVPSAGGRAALAGWLAGLLEARRPPVVILDAFPAGLLGEWCGLPVPPETRLWHVARLLRWDAYRARLAGPPPRLERSFIAERLARRHRRFLGAVSGSVERLRLPVARVASVAPPAELAGAPFWLVAHAGDARETAALARHADALRRATQPCARLVIATPGELSISVPGALLVDVNPASALFAHAARIVTAAGFNSMREAAPYRAKHLCLPLARALDDQFRRAARARARTA